MPNLASFVRRCITGSGLMLTVGLATAQATLTVDRLDAGDVGGPAPANLVVVDVFANVAVTDTWTASGLRATTANGALLRYGAGNALVNPGLADRFVTCVSRPVARNADARFNGALAALAGRFDPTGPTATATNGELNVTWFSSPPATSTSPSVDGYIARIAIDIAASSIDPATIVVAPGTPPAGTVLLLQSQPAPNGSATTGTVVATFDVPAVNGLNWCVYASPPAPVALSVDRLDAGDLGGPAPANLVVVDVFADVAATDTWTAAGLRATTANGAVLRYGAASAVVDPGLADRFVTCLSRPFARNADTRFHGALAALAGRYDPSGPTATTTTAELNVAWFSSPPATSTSPSVDGYIARIAIDIAAVTAIDPATIVVAPGLPPPGSVALLVSQPTAGSGTGTVAATFDVPAVRGLDWCVYADPLPPCEHFVGSSDPAMGACNSAPFGASVPTSLTTPFAANANVAAGGAVYFDVTVVNALYLVDLALNTNAAIGTPLQIEVWRTQPGGTRVGNETNRTAWVPETAGFGTAAGPGTPSVIALNSPLRLGPGRSGLAIVARNFAPAVTLGASTVNDTALTIVNGAATDVPFAAPVLSPRTANVQLRYLLDNLATTNQRYQTIVRRSQLTAGRITGLAFATCATGAHWNESLQIRMSHVPANHTLSTTFAANLPNPVTVLHANDWRWPVVGNAWNDIGLQSSFQYDGTSDLVIEIVTRGNHHTANTAFHRTSTTPRVVTQGFTGANPTTATTADNAGIAMRVQFGCASAATFGWACGRLRSGFTGTPRLASAIAFTFRDAPANAPAFLNVGFDNGLPSFPYDLAQHGLPTCHLFHDIIAIESAVANASGTGGHGYVVPRVSSFVGVRFHGQWLTLDATGPGGFAVAETVRVSCGL